MKHWNFVSRRAFNQHKALFDCILHEVKTHNDAFFHALSGGTYTSILMPTVTQRPEDMPTTEAAVVAARAGTVTTESETEDPIAGFTQALECLAKIPGLTLQQSIHQWTSLQQWREHAMQDPPSKSKPKYTVLIDYFVHHPLFNSHWSLHEIMAILIAKVIVFYGRGQYTEETIRHRIVVQEQRVNMRMSRVRSAADIVDSLQPSSPMVCTAQSVGSEQQIKTRKRRRQQQQQQAVLEQAAATAAVLREERLQHHSPDAHIRLAGLHIDEHGSIMNPLLLTSSSDRHYSHSSSTEHDDHPLLSGEPHYLSCGKPLHPHNLSCEDLMVHPFIFEDSADLELPYLNLRTVASAPPVSAAYYHNPAHCVCWRCNSLHRAHSASVGMHGYGRSGMQQQQHRHSPLCFLPSVPQVTPSPVRRRQQQHHTAAGYAESASTTLSIMQYDSFPASAPVHRPGKSP
jgi:hypothetical protein